MAKILVVDDDQALRTTVSGLLESGSHEVVEAENGERGLEVFRESVPDVALIDLMMPIKDGITLIQEILVQFPRARIIAMSGGPGGNPSWLPIAKNAGALRVLKKPFNRELLLETVTEVLANPWR